MAPGGECSRRGVVRIDFYCTAQQIERLLCSLGIRREHERKGSHCKPVGVEVLRSFPLRALDFGAPDLRQDCAHYTFGDAVLQSEQIADRTVIGVAPEVQARGRFKQANDDAHTLSALYYSPGDQ